MIRLFWLLAVCLALMSSQAFAMPPSPRLDKALCNRTATLLACIDADNNTYSVALAGKTLFVRGYESAGNRRWAQTNSRYGPLTFFTGLASDGETWVGYVQKVGWTTITRVSSSSGSRTKIICDRVMGCR
jgi:hypothetical protein